MSIPDNLALYVHWDRVNNQTCHIEMFGMPIELRKELWKWLKPKLKEPTAAARLIKAAAPGQRVSLATVSGAQWYYYAAA